MPGWRSVGLTWDLLQADIGTRNSRGSVDRLAFVPSKHCPRVSSGAVSADGRYCGRSPRPANGEESGDRPTGYPDGSPDVGDRESPSPSSSKRRPCPEISRGGKQLGHQDPELPSHPGGREQPFCPRRKRCRSCSAKGDFRRSLRGESKAIRKQCALRYPPKPCCQGRGASQTLGEMNRLPPLVRTDAIQGVLDILSDLLSSSSFLRRVQGDRESSGRSGEYLDLRSSDPHRLRVFGELAPQGKVVRRHAEERVVEIYRRPVGATEGHGGLRYVGAKGIQPVPAESKT